MAGIILCKSKYADKPYFISNMGVNIYSVEELCYYIYNNIYLIGTDLFSNGLVDYLEKELDENDFAKQLDFLIKQKAGLSELVLTTLRYVDYYSEDEIMELKDVIDKLDVQNVAERLKSRADSFLKNERYNSAIKNYELIVYGNRDKTLSSEFYGNVWHNMGVAYARMYSFYDAGICFKTAYDMNHNEESQKMFLAAVCMDHGNRMDDESNEQLYVAYREIETLMDHAPMEEEYKIINEANELRRQGHITEYYNALNEIINKWEDKYRHYIK